MAFLPTFWLDARLIYYLHFSRESVAVGISNLQGTA